ncbi:acyl carrier protein phosphodiesterase [Massilia sp. H-1]|nr:acyl carrier protein phosphodiesterase [Massilia sp. H-1]
MLDVFYDHVLAANWRRYDGPPLAEFVAHFYQTLRDKSTLLPPATGRSVAVHDQAGLARFVCRLRRCGNRDPADGDPAVQKWRRDVP